MFDINEATGAYPTEDEPNYLVRFEMEQEPQVIHRGNGTVDDVAGTSGRTVVAVQFVDGRFIVSGVNYESA